MEVDEAFSFEGFLILKMYPQKSKILIKKSLKSVGKRTVISSIV